MTSPDSALRQCWQHLAAASPAGGPHDRWLDVLIARHAEPHRRYHTATHVMWVLRHVDELLATERVGADADAVRAAALFHDIVYDPRSGTNEHDSAVIASGALTELGWSPARVDRVRTLIEATAGHRRDRGSDDGTDRRDLDLAVLLDADLAVLGAEPGAYQAYVHGVRAEYAHLDDDTWRSGRSAVLHSFLDRDQIYATATMRAARERRARANLTAELAELAAGR